MIILKNITKQYEKTVFENFSLNIDEGITTSIMGKSGCGKTTLFNMLCKTTLPDSGEIKGRCIGTGLLHIPDRSVDAAFGQRNLQPCNLSEFLSGECI